ncbi:MAG: hypothetical protein IPG22_20390 [Acidobacteria bacterium]|nr:hypothetical protein [Acidobacteriota bacterium]
MSYDYKTLSDDKPKPMSRKQWAAMGLPDQARFIKLGGRLFDEIEVEIPTELETMTSKSGQTITRGQWDAMTGPQKAEFVRG